MPSATLPFVDSFDHYNAPATKWFIGAGSIDLTGTVSRTGVGCLDVTGATDGPFLLFDGIPRFISGTAFFTSNFPQPPFAEIMQFIETATNTRQVRLVCFPDLSLGVYNESAQLGRSAAGQLTLGSYNYIEIDATISALGSVTVRVNEQVILSLTNVRTQFPGSLSIINAWRLKGFGITAAAFHDDVYIIEGVGSFGQSFLGAIKTQMIVPTGDSSPLQWTPQPGPTHFGMVDEVPPDGNTTYVESDTVNQQDQYTQPNTLVIDATSIPFVQHCLCMTDAAVARSVGSSADGVPTAGRALTDAYLIYQFPDTTGTWDSTRVAATRFGPIVTA